MRVPVVVVLVGLLGGLLTGCGGEPSAEDYCEQLRADREEIAAMVSSDSPGALLGRLDLLEGLGEQAPRDLRDEWDTFLAALRGLQDALDEAGADPEDFDDGQAPQGLSAAQRAAVVEAADRVRADDVVAAAGGIEAQARDVCKVNLGL